jgi:hypothetical protein
MPEYDWSGASPRFAELEAITHKADQISKAVMVDMKSQYAIVNDEMLHYDSDSNSESESTYSDETFEDIVEDLNAYMESLDDLSFSLDDPATDLVLFEDTTTVPQGELSTVSEPARSFVRIIQDRFPSLDPQLIRKLGEANWQRRQRLREKLNSAPEFNDGSSSTDGSSSIEDTVVDPRRRVGHDQQTIGSTVRSSMSAFSHQQSITTAFGFSEPSIFDNQSIHAPVARRVSRAESVTSFATSMADGPDRGHRRIPNLPEDHEYGSTFPCPFCGEILRDVQNRADWK